MFENAVPRQLKRNHRIPVLRRLLLQQSDPEAHITIQKHYSYQREIRFYKLL